MKTTTLVLALAAFHASSASILPSDASIRSHPEVARFRSLPKMDGDQLRRLTQGFYTMLQLHAAQVDPSKPLERVLLEHNKHLFSEKIKNAVDAQIVGLKGDIKHSDKLTDKVGETLGTARGYFDKVKSAKEKLENPVGAIGDVVSDSLGGIASTFGFRNLEEAADGEEGEGRVGFQTVASGESRVARFSFLPNSASAALFAKVTFC